MSKSEYIESPRGAFKSPLSNLFSYHDTIPMLYNQSLLALILYASNLLFIIAYVLFGLSLWRYVHLTRHDIVKGLVKKTKGQNTSIDKDDMAHAMAQ